LGLLFKAIPLWRQHRGRESSASGLASFLPAYPGISDAAPGKDLGEGGRLPSEEVVAELQSAV